ncbi:hypothetical protein Nepgr_011962 [Nepenthes gracilis]|uniref:PGG domain-containing protein n=1 Tax=Nepenthes gracilis TaxID=150966 RepID=A0AAD3SGN9_NEPGR|nr:hypothetical protein Nepgr_011962 [Nepenthes gracilis]
MEAPVRQQSFRQRKITKQLTGKRGDPILNLAVREGNLKEVLRIVASSEDVELKGLLSMQNQSGETALFVAAECGYVDVVKELIKHYDMGSAAIKAKNGYDAFHVAAKQGNLDILKILTEALPELLMTTDLSNTTALHTAASQGHTEVVNFLLERNSNLATIARNNGKTSLHSAARNGHLEVVEALMSKEPGIALRIDKKGQTALHMAVKGQSIELVDMMIKPDPSLINVVDSKGNTALHIAARKGRAQIVMKLLDFEATDKEAINKSRETALDTAEKAGYPHITAILRDCGVRSGKSIVLPASSTARELKQTVSEIKHEVHDQILNTRQTRKRMQHIAKRLNKMHTEGINNAINSSTIVAVLIATIAFAAIFTAPGQYADGLEDMAPGLSPGEANIAPRVEFMIFFIFDSFALFISLAVVVVQTSVVIIERKAKKKMVAVINKLMWLACVFISVSFLALSYIILGNNELWLAITVTVIGTVILATTLGVMCYWVVRHRIEANKLKSIRKSSMSSKSRSRSMSMMMSDTEILENEYKKLYAV